MSLPDQENTSGIESGTSPTQSNPANGAICAVEKAVAQLELARIYIERDLEQTRAEMRDVRDRLKAVEVKIEALPSKVWIGSVVLGGMTLLSFLFGAIVVLVRVLAH